MPRSFLVKKVKCDDDKPFHYHYRPKEIYDDDIDDSLRAIAPYTPSSHPLAVRVNNGKSSLLHAYLCRYTKLIWKYWMHLLM